MNYYGSLNKKLVLQTSIILFSHVSFYRFKLKNVSILNIPLIIKKDIVFGKNNIIRNIHTRFYDFLIKKITNNNVLNNVYKSVISTKRNAASIT